MTKTATQPAGGQRTGVSRKEKVLEAGDSLLIHDINNLSFRLGSLIQNLDNNYEDPLFKKSVVEILTDAVDRMDRIVRQFRVNHGGVIVKIPLDVNEVLSRIVEGLPRLRYEEKGIRIREDYSELPNLWGDPEVLREAFAILVTNAIQAMEPKGGLLSLSTRLTRTAAGQRQVAVSVADEGRGMSREFVRDCLFTPFISTKKGGLGMGLYTCRRIIAMHDGRIRVSSREGRGTQFRILFRVS